MSDLDLDPGAGLELNLPDSAGVRMRSQTDVEAAGAGSLTTLVASTTSMTTFEDLNPTISARHAPKRSRTLPALENAT